MRFIIPMLLAGCLAVGALGSCTNMAGVWHDSATDDVMNITESGCVLLGKYGEVRVDVTTRKVVPQNGLLKTLGIMGKWHPFDEAIAWSNGVSWRKRAECTDPNAPTPVPATASPGSPDDLQQKLDDAKTRITNLEKLISEITTKVDNMNTTEGPAGRNGYCIATPNATSVYQPKKVFTSYKFGTPNCVADSSGHVYDTQGCRWGYDMARTITITAGDELFFWRPPKGGAVIDLWEFNDEAAYNECNFGAATQRQSPAQFDALEAMQKNFSITFDKPGNYYFGSDVPMVTDDVDRREYCWNPSDMPTGPVASKPSGWGLGIKTMVQVLNPAVEEMVTCPLWDPSKNGTTDEVDSESVSRLKGSVAAIGRHLVQDSVRTAQRVREEGQSGLTLTRGIRHSLDSYYEPSFGTIGAGSIHNHANARDTIGLGEMGAVLNGVQFNTRHNDYSLLEADDSLSAKDYIASWPPKTKRIEPPAVPPSVTSAGSIDAQVKEMAEFFKAFKTQNETHRPYKTYFKPVLCYLEGTWAEAHEGLAEPFASERHKIDADSWTDLNDKMNFLLNNGQKHILENIAFLPSSIRGMRSDGKNTFEPHESQWFYRISCQPLANDVPTKRFRVRNDLQIQLRMARPVTREFLEDTMFALYDVNPVLEKDWKPDTPWAKGPLKREFMDELMEQVPGLDGPKASLVDDSFGLTCKKFDGTGILDTAKYSRYFTTAKDASGRVEKKRGFNDFLFASQTTHPRVSSKTACGNAVQDGDPNGVPTAEDKANEAVCNALTNKLACSEKKWDDSQVTGANGGRCSWIEESRCVYKKCWTQSWSYAIPLEIVYMTPLLRWNPYNLPFHEKNTPGYDAVVSASNDGRTAATPYKGSRQDKFFRTPAHFYGDLRNPDPADTSGGLTYVEDASGVVHQTRPSGTWVHTPSIAGVGSVRTRYPIFPLHEHGNTVWKEVKALTEVVMGQDSSKELKDIMDEERPGVFGMVLQLSGGGHDHYVRLDPNEVKLAKTGAKTEFIKIATEANAHQHLVSARYNPSTDTWTLGWCTQGADPSKPCPASTVNSGACAANPVSCCPAMCPDGHNSIFVYV